MVTTNWRTSNIPILFGNSLFLQDIAEANTDETRTRTRTVDKLMNNVNDQEKGRQETAASKESKMMDESSGGIQGGRTMQKPKNRKLADDGDDDLLVNHVQESHKKKISGVSRINNKSVVSVSSFPPHHHEKHSLQTEFNIDYSLPMTHPPSHN